MRSARDCYDDRVATLDKELNRLMNELAVRSLLQNTLVIITSDHGENFGEHGLYLHHISLHRPELDVPLLMVWPGHVPEGRVVTEPRACATSPQHSRTCRVTVNWPSFPGAGRQPLAG